MASAKGRSGSSPLTRGKRAARRLAEDRGWLIPAHAGKTSWRSGAPPSTAAHPRSRGENLRSRPYSARLVGSSPLTRGKHRGPEGHVRGGRLIPAHAGKTTRSRRCPRLPPAHPRSRGENVQEGADAGIGFGSSPLTRGKPSWVLLRSGPPRLIPAHAGKTRKRPGGRYLHPAHPRSRGEN